MNICFFGPKNQNGTFCMSTDGFQDFLLSFCAENPNKIQKYNYEDCSGFLTAAFCAFRNFIFHFLSDKGGGGSLKTKNHFRMYRKY